jgi:hypothetical protein
VVFQRDKNEENGPNVREAARPIPLRAGALSMARFSREKEQKKKDLKLVLCRLSKIKLEPTYA